MVYDRNYYCFLTIYRYAIIISFNKGHEGAVNTQQFVKLLSSR